jgi:hypothetical protein
MEAAHAVDHGLEQGLRQPCGVMWPAVEHDGLVVGEARGDVPRHERRVVAHAVGCRLTDEQRAVGPLQGHRRHGRGEVAQGADLEAGTLPQRGCTRGRAEIDPQAVCHCSLPACLDTEP